MFVCSALVAEGRSRKNEAKWWPRVATWPSNTTDDGQIFLRTYLCPYLTRSTTLTDVCVCTSSALPALLAAQFKKEFSDITSRKDLSQRREEARTEGRIEDQTKKGEFVRDNDCTVRASTNEAFSFGTEWTNHRVEKVTNWLDASASPSTSSCQ